MKCTAGTYMSRKLRMCATKDPYAEEFDEINEFVVKCRRGYTVSSKGCLRVK